MNKPGKKAQGQETTRQVRREMGRHSIECGDVQVNSNFGVIYLNGRVRAMRGHESEMDAEIDALLKSLRQTPGVKDVITAWTVIR